MAGCLEAVTSGRGGSSLKGNDRETPIGRGSEPIKPRGEGNGVCVRSCVTAFECQYVSRLKVVHVLRWTSAVHVYEPHLWMRESIATGKPVNPKCAAGQRGGLPFLVQRDVPSMAAVVRACHWLHRNCGVRRYFRPRGWRNKWRTRVRALERNS